MINHFFENLCA